MLIIGLIPEKTKQEGLRTYFFENNPEMFCFFHFNPGNSRQNKAPALATLEIPIPKTKTLWKFYMIFSWSSLPRKFHLVFN